MCIVGWTKKETMFVLFLRNKENKSGFVQFRACATISLINPLILRFQETGIEKQEFRDSE